MKYATQTALLADIEAAFDALVARLASIPRERWVEPGVWGDGWSINDLIAHLTAWHGLLLGWYRAGEAGKAPELPAAGYKWNETPRLNRAIQAEHAGRDAAELWSELEASHAEVMTLAKGLSEEQIMEPGHFPWTGRNGLVTYVGANTASHYRFAVKVLKRWSRVAK